MKIAGVVVIAVITAAGAYKLGESGSASAPRGPAADSSLVYTSRPENSILGNQPSVVAVALPAQTDIIAVTAPPQLLAKPRPLDERRFVDVIATHVTRFTGAANDMAKGASRPARANALCAAMASPVVSNWVGKIETLSSNSDGLGVLSIEIAPDLFLKTWNNSFSDITDKTLLPSSGRVFSVASTLATGREVRFSGTLIRASTDCFRETSMSQQGSMTSPEFLFRFTDIAPIGSQ